MFYKDIFWGAGSIDRKKLVFESLNDGIGILEEFDGNGVLGNGNKW